MQNSFNSRKAHCNKNKKNLAFRPLPSNTAIRILTTVILTDIWCDDEILEIRELGRVEIIWNWERRATKGSKMLHEASQKKLNNLHSPNRYNVSKQIKVKVMKRECSRNLYKVLAANCECRTSLGKAFV